MKRPYGRVAVRAVVVAATAVMTLPLWWIPAGSADFGHVVTNVTREAATQHRRVPTARSVPVVRARLRDLPRGTREAVPVSIAIPRIGMRAAVVPVGVVAGTTEIPVDVSTVGWYRYGPSPGERGSAVLVGHVDSPAHGVGAFATITALERGDRVEVRMTNGRMRAFRVVGRTTVPKALLPDSVFRRDGRPTLTLITCGGTFDSSAGHYTDNVVVAAVPDNGPS